ncbi:MAG: LON peptidase substrate-binding domain-containing protein [Thermoleophilia bacterium]|nr:LON peptidase substrate-binding domain-containing protein [Thermoleophilia bacterium]
MREIGLFPLELVLLPGEQLPLHIFEPRYRELVGECLARDEELGLVLADDEHTRELGTTAALVDVLARYEDGRLDVLAEGRTRFRIVEETAGRSFRTALVELVADEPGEPSSRELATCVAAYRRLAEAAGADFGEPSPGPEGLAYWIAARVGLGTDSRQGLLELLSERERISALTDLLVRARTATRYARLARERAQANGRVEPPG